MPERFQILLAEDDSLARSMTERLLIRIGYEVTCAVNGARALELFKEHFFPIVLTDWMMPEMDGIALCRAIREFHLGEYVFIVFLTTNDTKDNIIKGLEAGADDYLTKPFNPIELSARLASGRRILTLQKSMREANERLAHQVKFNETLMNTIPNPVFHKDRHGLFMGCNTAMASRIAGVASQDMRGKTLFDMPYVLDREAMTHIHQREQELLQSHGIQTYEARLNCTDGKTRDFLVNKATFENGLGEVGGLIGVMVDISEKNEMLKIQNLNIQAAKRIMDLVNPPPERRVDLSPDLSLFTDVLSLPCHQEGGDHGFIRSISLSGADPRPRKTVISLKDQSGHQVGCILRSIITDLLHHALLTHAPALSLEESLSQLNNGICDARLFDPEDYFTAITAEIHYPELRLKVASAGHPPLLLIRGTSVMAAPLLSGRGYNLPIGTIRGFPFSTAEHTLEPGDRLIFYTDGLTEMPLRRGGAPIQLPEFIQQVAAIVRDDPAMPVTEIMDHLLRDIAVMSGEDVVPSGPEAKNTSQDDVTLIGIELEDRRRLIERVLRPRNVSELSGEILALYEDLRPQWIARGFTSPEDRLRLLLEEAVVNAWKHGNQRDPEKTVTVRWRFGNDFCLEVIDQGNGFTPQPEYDPTSKPHLLLDHGRGIFMMRHYSDRLHWRKGGRHLTAFFSKQPSPHAQADPSPPIRLWEPHKPIGKDPTNPQPIS